MHGYNNAPIENYMYFHVCKKIYSASSSQRMFTILVSFESLMNKAINKGYLVKFQHCILNIQQFKVSRNFENATFPLTSMVTLPKKCSKKFISFQKIVTLKCMHGIK